MVLSAMETLCVYISATNRDIWIEKRHQWHVLSLFSKIFIRKVKVSLVTFHGYLLL